MNLGIPFNNLMLLENSERQRFLNSLYEHLVPCVPLLYLKRFPHVVKEILGGEEGDD